jgi:hypothetical protein
MTLLEQIKADKLNDKQIGQLADRMRINQINYPEWRLGQLLFNSLYEVKPRLANLIRGTRYDPYYWSMLRDKKEVLNLTILLTNPDKYEE